MKGFVNGLNAPPIMRLNPDHVDIFFEKAGTYSYTIPRGAKSIDVTVIGSGGGGQEGGVSYGNIQNAWPGGGAGGAAGEMKHLMRVSVTPGTTYQIRVGKGGAAFGGAGEASKFGELLSAAGGLAGGRGDHEPLDDKSTANGGRGGNGGIGGNGGGRGRGRYSHQDGADGADGTSSMEWQSWTPAQWYAFEDASTGKRLGNGGRGGDGHALNALSTRKEIGKTTAEVPGKTYGGGGRGGDQQKTGQNKTPGAGQGGLVAVRVWYKKR